MADPAGIYGEDGSLDWRSWTIEVRVSTEVDLNTILDKDELVLWTMDPHLEDYIVQQVSTGAASFAWWEALLQSRARRIEESGADTPRLLALIDQEVRARCLP